MADGTKEVVQQPKTYTADDFVKEYKALVEKTRFQIVVQPVYVARDDGSFSTVLQTQVGEIKKSK